VSSLERLHKNELALAALVRERRTSRSGFQKEHGDISESESASADLRSTDETETLASGIFIGSFIKRKGSRPVETASGSRDNRRLQPITLRVSYLDPAKNRDIHVYVRVHKYRHTCMHRRACISKC